MKWQPEFGNLIRNMNLENNQKSHQDYLSMLLFHGLAYIHKCYALHVISFLENGLHTQHTNIIINIMNIEFEMHLSRRKICNLFRLTSAYKTQTCRHGQHKFSYLFLLCIRCMVYIRFKNNNGNVPFSIFNLYFLVKNVL